MDTVASPTHGLILAARLRSQPFRTEFVRLFPEQAPAPDRPPFNPSRVSSDASWSELLSHPLAVRAARILVAGKPAEELALVCVIGAHLAAGPAGWQIMGLIREEARELLYEYCILLYCKKRKDLNLHLQMLNTAFALVDHAAVRTTPSRVVKRLLRALGEDFKSCPDLDGGSGAGTRRQ